MRCKIFSPALVLPLTFACAPFQQVAASPLTPEQSSLIETTCTNVMGLRKGEFYFEQCQDSLTHSMMRKMAAMSSADAYNDCRKRGLAEGSAALSVCALNAANVSRADTVTSQPVDLGSTNAVLESGKSYYDVRPSVQFQRYRYACAQLGLMPNSGLFGTCVASLTGELSPNTD
jgi:hypothetical protein